MRWIVRVNETDYEIEDLAILHQWIKEGRVQQDNYVYDPRVNKWSLAGQIEELRFLFSQNGPQIRQIPRRPSGRITDEGITRERNMFLYTFAALVLAGIAIKILALIGFPGINELALQGTVVAKGAFVYVLFRLSRYLKLPIWLTIVYCLLSLFSILYLISLIGLLVHVKSKRKLVAEGKIV